MPARGVEVGVGYVSVVPSAEGFAAALRRQVGGENLGRNIGDDINKGIKGRLGDGVDLPTKHLRDRATSEGASIGANMKAGVDKGLSGLKNVAIGLGGLGAGAVVVGKMFFDAFSDLTESTSKAQVVFGDSYAGVDVFAQGAAKSLGMSHQAALEAAGTFGNLFRAMKLGTDESAQMSTGVISLASDLASFNNASPEDVLVALKAGLVGETEPLRAFGVNLSAARVEAEALRLGLAKGNVNMVDVQSATQKVEKATAAQVKALKEGGESSLAYREATTKVSAAQEDLEKALEGGKVELDAGQKAQAAYSLIMADTTLAQGDFARTSEGAANKTRILTAQWEDFKAKVGEKVAPLGAAVLGGLSSGLDAVSKWWDEHGQAVVDGIGSVGTTFHDLFGADPVANFVTGADIVIAKFHEVFGEEPVANFHAGANELNFAWQEFEAGSVRTAAVTGPVFDAIGTGVLGIGQLFADLGKVMGTLGEPLGWIVDRIEDIPGAIGYLGEPLGWLVERVESVGNVFGKAGEPIGSVVDRIESIPGLIAKLGEPLGWLVEKLEWLLEHNPAAVLGDVGKSLHIPGYAEGGVIPGTVGSPQLIVAHGGETVLPTHRSDLAAMRGATIASAHRATAAPTTGPLVGHLEVNGQADPNASAWLIRRELRRISYFAGSGSP